MKILIVSHDAGGAEIISAWVKANLQNNYIFILQGPAVAVFSRKISKIDNQPIEKLLQNLSQVEFVLTGTSWGSDLEREVIKIALKHNVFVVAYLDHWVNYLERFLSQGKYCFPNEIWVGDEEAERLAKNVFKQIPVRLVLNQYFEEVKREFKKIAVLSRPEKYNFLYVCEPIEGCAIWKTGNKNDRYYTEFSALQFFFDEMRQSRFITKIEAIKLRLHPSEPREKYNSVIENERRRFPCNIIVGENTSLLEDYVWADYIVGISSMALVIAAILKKDVFTCIPDGAAVAELPISGIRRINTDFNIDSEIK